MFRDYLGREIKIDDVIACGQRQGSYGGLTVGIVRGFTAQTILIDAIGENWRERGKLDENGFPIMRSWRLYKSRLTVPEHCFITGWSREQLLDLAGIPAEQGVS